MKTPEEWPRVKYTHTYLLRALLPENGRMCGCVSLFK